MIEWWEWVKVQTKAPYTRPNMYAETGPRASFSIHVRSCVGASGPNSSKHLPAGPFPSGQIFLDVF